MYGTFFFSQAYVNDMKQKDVVIENEINTTYLGDSTICRLYSYSFSFSYFLSISFVICISNNLFITQLEMAEKFRNRNKKYYKFIRTLQCLR